MFALIKSTFSKESFTTSVAHPCLCGSVNLFRNSPVFCSSVLFILVDVASSIMILLPWNSIPRKSSNSAKNHEMVCCFLFDVVVCLKVDFPEGGLSFN